MSDFLDFVPFDWHPKTVSWIGLIRELQNLGETWNNFEADSHPWR